MTTSKNHIFLKIAFCAIAILLIAFASVSNSATSKTPTATDVKRAATSLDSRNLPYCYGGGHDVSPIKATAGQYCIINSKGKKSYNKRTVGFDSSSSIAYVLQQAGFIDLPGVAGEFTTWGEPGPGKTITIFSDDMQVYMKIGTRYFGTSKFNHRYGPGFIPRSKFKLPSGMTARHPAGL